MAHFSLYRVFLCLVFLMSGLTVFAQNTTVTGIVLDSKSGQPIEFATVFLADPHTEQPIAGSNTDANGRFSIVTEAREFYLEVRFMGFEVRQIRDFTQRNGEIDLGEIALVAANVELDAVVIESEKSEMVFKLDKRVFNVGEDLQSTGMSALDLLNNVPSVNVDIEGQISLRGATGVQVLINGKPSVLASEEGNALGTITSDMIERVEVITNPSAKYEAEGSAGIINIVLKKEERKGFNGGISVNTGWPHNHSIGGSVNRRTEKFNLFSQFGAGYRSLPRYRKNDNVNLLTGSAIFSEGTEFRNENFYNIVLGTDYHINDNNVLTLSGSFAYEIEDQPSTFNFEEVNGNGDLITAWERTESTQATNPKWQYELQYKREFDDDEDHTLLMSAIGNFFGKDLESEFQNQATFGSLENTFQTTETAFSEARNTFQLDYTKPFAEKWTLETGAHYAMQDVRNDFAVSSLVNDVLVSDPGLTNIFSFDQKVLGVYGTGALELARWGVKLGLRVENTDLRTLLETTGERNDRNYTNFFPSFHTSYKFNERVSMQVGYSRRIFRPRLWSLNPFFNIRNNFSIRTGNPNLQPEFSDVFELTGIYYLNKISLNASVFHNRTTDNIERVTIFEENVAITRPINLGTNSTTGFEFNGKYSPVKWLDVRGEFGFNYFDRQGEFQGTNFDFAAQQWNSELNAKLKLPREVDVETTGEYRSGVQTLQGERSGFALLNLGLRKKMLDGRLIANFSVRDVFASRIDETVVFTNSFYNYNWGQRGRFLTLGLSYGFGKGEAMEYSGRRR